LGGNSGSLILEQTTGQPVALLFAGSWDTDMKQKDSDGNPLTDVINAFSNIGVTLSVKGGNTHPITACPGKQGPIMSREEAECARLVKEKYKAQLFLDPAVIAIGVGAADDNPLEGVVAVTIQSGKPYRPIPPVLDSVRTKIEFGEPIRPLAQQTCSGKKQK
jgi:hypothetical protein